MEIVKAGALPSNAASGRRPRTLPPRQQGSTMPMTSRRVARRPPRRTGGLPAPRLRICSEPAACAVDSAPPGKERFRHGFQSHRSVQTAARMQARGSHAVCTFVVMLWPVKKSTACTSRESFREAPCQRGSERQWGVTRNYVVGARRRRTTPPSGGQRFGSQTAQPAVVGPPRRGTTPRPCACGAEPDAYPPGNRVVAC